MAVIIWDRQRNNVISTSGKAVVFPTSTEANQHIARLNGQHDGRGASRPTLDLLTVTTTGSGS
jgi:hypothetical protein